jgi:PAS domain S-box-containing protein
MSEALPQLPLTPPLPANETERLAALHRYRILDTPPEAAFDRITALATRLFNMPIALVSLVDESRAWFKSCIGFDATEVPRDATLCSFAVLTDEPLIIPDVRLDDRFTCNPFVQSEPGVRFYAGAPLLSQDGFNLGTLCLLDSQPRDPFTPEQQATLVDLAAMVVDELELRLAAQQIAQVNAALRESEELKQRILESSNDCIKVLNLDSEILYINTGGICLLDIDDPTLVLQTNWIDFWQGKDQEQAKTAIAAAQAGSMSQFQGICPTRKGTLKWWDSILTPVRDALGQVVQLVVISRDITERQHIENERKQAQKRLSAIFYRAAAGLSEMSLTGQFQRVNDELCRLVGRSREDLLVNSVTDVTHPEDVAKSLAAFATLIQTGEPVSFDKRYLRPDGTIVWANSNLTRLDDEQGHPQAVLAVTIDLSDRKQAELEIQKFASLADNSTEFIGMCDMNFLPFYVNAAGMQLVGLDDVQQYQKTPVREFFFPEDQDFIVNEFFPHVLREGRAEVEIRFRHFKTGEAVWMIYNVFFIRGVNYQPIGLATVSRNITDRKQAEEIVRQSEERSRLAIRVAQLGLWRYDPNTDSVELDERMRQIWGEPENTVALALSQVIERIHPDDRARVTSAIRAALDPGLPAPYEIDYRIVWNDGRERWLSANGQATFSGEGASRQAVEFLGTALDITDRKTAEAEREQLLQREQAARAEAERANRIKDEFLAVLSHELRSPLNPILGWTRLLQTTQLDAARQREALATIERNAKLQTQLIEDLLDISRIMQGKLSLTVTPVSLTFVITAAVETVKLAAEAKQIQILLDLTPVIAPVSGDAARLQQVFGTCSPMPLNLPPKQRQVTVELRQLDQLTQIRVIDTGRGIDPQFLPHVFEYFRQQTPLPLASSGAWG